MSVSAASRRRVLSAAAPVVAKLRAAHRISVRATFDALERRTLLAAVDSIAFDVDSPTHDVVVTFDSAIDPTSVSASDLIVEKVGSDTRLPSSGFLVSVNASATKATFKLPARYPDGDYVVTLPSEDVFAANGAFLNMDASAKFFFKTGDATGASGVRDRAANAADESLVGVNYGLAPATFSQGDLDYDGSVTASDFDYLDYAAAMAEPIVGVSGVTASEVAGGVEVRWVRQSTVNTGFRVQRSADRGRTFTTIASNVAANAVSYLDATANLTGIGSYVYRVRSIEPNEPFSNLPRHSRYFATTLHYGTLSGGSPIQPPGSLEVTSASKNSLTLSWIDTSTGETGHEIFRSIDGGVTWPVRRLLSVPNATGWTDTNLKADKTYHYKVRTLGATTSGDSNMASETTLAGAPAVIDGSVETANAPQYLVAEFDQVILQNGASLDNAAVAVYSLTGGRQLVGGGAMPEYVVAGIAGDRLRIRVQGTHRNDLPAGVTGVLSDGNYEIIVRGDAVKNAAGETIAEAGDPEGEGIARAFFYRGDINGDRQVNFADLVILAQNYNGTNKTYAQGDLNYDGSVNFSDLVTLAQRYQSTFPAPLVGVSAAQASTGALADPEYDPLGTATPSNAAYVEWTAPAAAEGSFVGFKVWRSIDGVNFGTPIATLPITQFDYIDRGLLEGERYTYRVRPYRADSSFGTVTNKAAVVTTLRGPTNVSAAFTSGNTLRVTWADNASNEDRFKVEVLDGAGQIVQTRTVGANSTFADVNGLDSTRTYTVRLSAETDAAVGRYPDFVVAAAENALSVTSPSPSRVELRWAAPNAGVGDELYHVERHTPRVDGQGVWKLVGTTAALTFADTMVEGSSEYHYRVRIGSAGPVHTQEVPTYTAPKPLVGLAAHARSALSVALTWGDAHGVNTGAFLKYDVQWRTQGGAWRAAHQQRIDATAGRMRDGFIQTNLETGVTYGYRVRPVIVQLNGYVQEGEWSTPKSATPSASVPQAPYALMTNAVSGSVLNAYWTDADGEVDGFYVYVSQNGSDFVRAIEIPRDQGDNGRYFARIPGLEPDRKYYVRVRSYDADGESAPATKTDYAAVARDGDEPSDPEGQAAGQDSKNTTDSANDQEGYYVIETVNAVDQEPPGDSNPYSEIFNYATWGGFVWKKINTAAKAGRFSATSLADALSQGLRAQIGVFSRNNETEEPNWIINYPQDRVLFLDLGGYFDVEDGPGAADIFEVDEFDSSSFLLWNRGADTHVYQDGKLGAVVKYVPGPPPCGCENQSEQPVKYGSGEVVFDRADLSSSVFGSAWGMTRSWKNEAALHAQHSGTTAGIYGNGVTTSTMPRLALDSAGGTLQFIRNGTNVREFKEKLDFEGSGTKRQATSSDDWRIMRQDPNFPWKPPLSSDPVSMPPRVNERFKWEPTAEEDDLRVMRIVLDASPGRSAEASGLRITDANGNQHDFYSFEDDVPAALQGTLHSWTDAEGVMTVIEFGATGTADEDRPVLVKRTHVDAPGAYESMEYAYHPTAAGPGVAGKVKSITLRNGRNDENDVDDFVRKVTYAYYGASEAHGNAGDLKHATTTDAGGEQLDKEYYRYWKANETGGYAGGLKSFFDAESYSRVVASVANPESATDTALRPFLTNYFEYDAATHRVTKEIAAKAGCSGTNNGQGIFTFAYEQRTDGASPSEWVLKTTETLFAIRDNAEVPIRENVVYTNAMGRRVGMQVVDRTSYAVVDQQHFTYNSEGQVTRVASASAISSFSGVGNIVGGQPYGLEGSPGLHDHQGLITNYAYTSSGQLSTVSIQRGEFGTPVPQSARSYGLRAIGDRRYEYVSFESAYPNGASSLATTTAYETDFHAGTMSVRSVQAHLPIVGTGQNGPGTSDASSDPEANTVFFDRFGRPVWTKDADGFVDFYEYDWVTGAVTKHVDDVKLSSLDADEQSALPSGWTVPSGGVHAQRTYEVDALGRPTRYTDPNGVDTFAFFDDARREVRIYSAWDYGANRPTLPAMIIREHRPTSFSAIENERRVYTETLTFAPAAYAVDAATDRPTGTDVVTSANLRSLNRQLTNTSGQVREVHEYFSLSDISYGEASAQLGTPSNDSSSTGNFHSTFFGYNEQGQRSRVIDATGTVTREVFDQYNRLRSTWVGTNDDGGTHWDPTGGGADPDNNMRKVRELWYDGAEPWADRGSQRVGNGLVTRVDEYTTDGQARVTRLGYDWRDRVSIVRQGDVAQVGPATIITHSNSEPSYPPATSVASFGSQPDTENVTLTAFEYDNLDRVTATSTYDGDNFRLFSEVVRSRVTDKTNQNGRVEYTGWYTPLLKNEWTFDASKMRSRVETKYDDRGLAYEARAVGVDPVSGSLGAALTSSAWYDRRGNLIATAAAGEATQKFSYDGAGRPVRQYVTDGSGTAGWASAGSVAGDRVLEQLLLHRDAAGNVFATERKQRFHDETANGALGTVSTGVKARTYYSVFDYDAADRLVASADLGTFGGATPTLADLQTIPARSDNALVTTYGYDDAGRRVSAVDPKGIESRNWFDLLGRTTRTIDAYVPNAPLSAANNQRVDYTYNGVGDLLTLSAVTAASATTPASPNGTPTAFQTTQYVYGIETNVGSANPLPSAFHSNRVLSAVRYPKRAAPNLGTPDDAQKEVFAYNLQGELTDYRDRNGTTHNYGYDIVGRQTLDEATALGTGVDAQVRKITTAYDSAGRAYLFSSLDGSGAVVNEVSRLFNGFGQLTAEYQSHDGAAVTSGAGADVKVGYAYSEAAGGMNHSRLTGLIYPDGKTLSYAYGSAGSIDDRISRLSSIGEAAQGGGTTQIESYGYLGLGTVISRYRQEADFGLTYAAVGGEPVGPAGDSYTGLDRFGRVVDQRWLRDDGTHVDRFGYAYDRNSNRLTRTNGVNAAFNETYGYDASDRLTSFARGNGGGGRTQSWSLDALGNWSSVTTNGSAQSRQHDGQNAIVGAGFGYSGNGEMTSARFGLNGSTVTQGYGYDAWGRLVGVDVNGNGSFADSGDREFEYDALGRRVQETARNGTGGGTTTDLYYSDRWQVLEERTRAMAAGEASALPARRNLWSAAYIDELIAVDRDANGSTGDGMEARVYVQQDANFNVTGLTDRQGNVVERYAYDAYGERTVLDASWATDADGASDVALAQGFQGARHDDATRLVHQRNRDLHVVLGRWGRQDPLGYLDGSNMLLGFDGNPISNLDPWGLENQTFGTDWWWGLDEWLLPDPAASYNDAVESADEMFDPNAGVLDRIGAAGGTVSNTISCAVDLIPGAGKLKKKVVKAVGDGAEDAVTRLARRRAEKEAERATDAQRKAQAAKELAERNANPNRVTNPKHHRNSPSSEPSNVDELFAKAVVDKNGVRWSKDSDGTIHRFCKANNGETHWNGSTAGKDGISPNNIPDEIKGALK